MPFPYETLTQKDNIDLNTAVKWDESFKFNVGTDSGITFINFNHKKRMREFNEKISTSWKFHLSIAPEELATAWDTVIWPILAENAISFKIVNHQSTVKQLKNNEAFLKGVEADLETIKQEFLAYERERTSSTDKAPSLPPSLNRFYQKGRTQKGENGNYISDREHSKTIFIDNRETQISTRYHAIVTYLETAIKDAHEAIHSNIRMKEGMQVTIYIPEGQEEHYQALAEKLEVALESKNIKPGKIYHTDEPMGDYCSRRHPGFHYRDGISVDGYNPDGAEDKFTCIKKKIRTQPPSSASPTAEKDRKNHDDETKKDVLVLRLKGG